jgi:hypothetical protein
MWARIVACSRPLFLETSFLVMMIAVMVVAAAMRTRVSIVAEVPVPAKPAPIGREAFSCISEVRRRRSGGFLSRGVASLVFVLSAAAHLIIQIVLVV